MKEQMSELDKTLHALRLCFLEKANFNFMKNPSKAFLNACNKVGIPPTRRQASKWSMQKGLAYKEGR